VSGTLAKTRLSPLEGIRVLEVGDSVAVAFCGKALADLGADIIMVEPPGGPRLRVWGWR
jgi:crotonobetainyl-CoA:carnitine CoA-transferase CaiB-like acyl-CoA transferase